jgi:dTDP-4-amino-4,6-dideoxygalactose transaminase/nucleoside-diphosphate-sugar epimerase
MTGAIGAITLIRFVTAGPLKARHRRRSVVESGVEISAPLKHVTLVGGAGFIGTATSRVLAGAGWHVTVVDRRAPVVDDAEWLPCDVLVDDLPRLPPGPVVLLHGGSDPRHPRPWTLPLTNALATARLLPMLVDRDVILVSSVEVYGAATGALEEDTRPALPGLDLLNDWCAEARVMAAGSCPDWRAAALGCRLAEADPSGRWTYALAKLAQERLVLDAVDPDRLTVLRLANVVGASQDRVVTRMVRRALAGLPLHVTVGVRRSFLPDAMIGRLLLDDIGPGIFNVGAPAQSLLDVAHQIITATGADVDLVEHPAPKTDSSGLLSADRLASIGHQVEPLASYLPQLVAQIACEEVPALAEPLPVVVPPRLHRPDVVVARQQETLRSGQVKHGNRWTRELQERLTDALGVQGDNAVLLTTSGTAALRLVVAAIAGPAQPGDLAVLPSFTFPATAEVLLQLGYGLRYADVDPSTWCLDAARLPGLIDDRVKVVVAVDTFGQPCDYAGLMHVCRAAGVPLVADSAAALGSRYQGRPVAGLADGHAYSMSFAKVLSSGGAGGALVLASDFVERLLASPAGWTRSELMTELHAVVALDQLAVLERMVCARERVAAIYRAAMTRMHGTVVQASTPGDRHSYVHWVMRTPARDKVRASLLRQGVATKPYFPALHRTTHPSGEHQHSLPMTERLHREALALPMSSEMDEAQADAVVFATARVLQRASVVDAELSAPAGQ